MSDGGTVAGLIARLGLAPHPEGGHYREVFRSAAQVRPEDGRPARAALTAIHFLLAAGERSRWHQVRSDEVWHHADGGPLELLLLRPDATAPVRVVLGDPKGGHPAFHVVPADWWQAARPLGAWALSTCLVAPGFDFADFRFAEDAATRAAIARHAPSWAGLL